MSLSLGLVGLPNAGKSTLFNALTRGTAAVAAYPFTTIDPNLGQVHVPDRRVEALAAVTHAARTVPATIHFVDIAGLVRGASKGEGLGNRFLAHIREVDAIVHVVRVAPDGVPVADAEIVETELALADLDTVERAVEKAISRVKAGEAGAREQTAILERLAEALGKGIPARHSVGNAAELASDLRLLTAKPVIYVANVNEETLPDGGSGTDALRVYADRQGAVYVVLAAKLEADLADLAPHDAKAYLTSVGLTEHGTSRLISMSFALLGLVSFFTILSNEVRAWPVPRGTTALAAAGGIHTDIARGFIRAEVVRWDTLVAAGSVQAARDRGLIRLEGRDYQVEDGDVMTVRFAP